MIHGNRFTALIDACVLTGVLKRNLILSLAEVGLYRVRWSKRILDETERAIEKIRGDVVAANRARKKMEIAFPEALTEYDQEVESRLSLPDADDQHVLAAAISARTDVIVTDNLRDFPAEALEIFDISAISPDHFIADALDLDPSRGLQAVKRMRARLIRNPYTAEELVHTMEKQGLVQTAAMLRDDIELI